MVRIYKKKRIGFKFFISITFSILFSLNLLNPYNISAETKIPRVQQSVKPLDLSKSPSKEELMAAGQLGGQLYHTHEIKGKKKEKKINLSFGQSIQEWNKHNYKNAVKLFRKHIKDFPDSPWVSEARLHIGCDARYNGRYTEAEDQFNWIIENNKDKPHEGAKRLKTKAMLRLGVLKVLQNNPDEATKIFADLKKESLSWRERTYASHWIQRISRQKAQGRARLKCGTEALAYIMEKKGNKVEAGEIAEMVPDTDSGHSMSDIIDIASGYGHELVGIQLTSSELNKIPLPAIMQISAKDDGEKGHYWVLDKIIDNNLELYDPQSRRRFSQSVDEFTQEWTGKTLVSATETKETIPGTILTAADMDETYGGCCGTPKPEEDLGDTDDDDDCSEGSPIWKVNNINLNLYIKDIPLWYTPTIGPSVKIKLSYNSQSAIANNEPFGNKWQFNYGSYLVEDTGGNVTIFMPDGRRDVFTPDGQGGYTKPFEVFNTLTQIAPNHFELEFLDGTVYVYDIPSGTSSLQSFLVETVDPYGQKLTFGYNSNVQLETIKDALNRTTTLTYNMNDLVERVDDPFSRSANFEYDANRNLTKITDMGGIWTQLSYDGNVYLTSIENERGKWKFYIEPSDGVIAYSDNYPPPGENTWESYRMTITHPLGEKEEYFYHGGCGSLIGISACGYGWYVSLRDYVPYVDSSNNNFMSAPKTYYYLDRTLQTGKISKITYPEGGYVDFGYDSVTGKQSTITDYHDHTRQFTYNSNGRTTSATDPKNSTTYTYYPNNIDVQTIADTLGTISYTYNTVHDITSVTDKRNITTGYEYNSYGQLTKITEAQGTPLQRITENVYNPTTYVLNGIKVDGNVVMTFTHDNIGRVKTRTDAKGLQLTYDYNDLNQVIKITYPDTKFETFNYSTCCPRILDSKTDRIGLTTEYTYDALKRLTQVQGPEGTIAYEYDANGNLTKITDADKKETSFEYNLDNRLVKKTYADGKFETYDYDLAGLLTKTTNSRNIEINYPSYDGNHNLLTIDYSDTTPDVTFTYDNFNRLETRTDAVGLYQYTYDAEYNLKTMDGPWANDTITLNYDELGRMKEMIPEGGQTINYTYDTIGRLNNIQPGAGTYTYGYTGVNPLIQNLNRPNGSITEYLYNDSLKRLTDVINKNSSSQVINSFNYTYNNLDLKGSETITNGDPITGLTEGLTTYNYNNVNQLLDQTDPNKSFTYDNDGNMTQSYTPDGYVIALTYDAENRLITSEYTDGASKVQKTEYTYSGDSLLTQVKKYKDTVLISDTRFVRAGFLPIQERDASNNVTREYTWGLNMGGGIGGLLNLKQGSNDYAYLYDGKGNVSAIIDGTQNVVISYRYDAFGKLMTKTGTLNQPFMFSTKRYDEGTGLSYYGYRYYSPSIGKWITRDPIEEAGGINLYGFVLNNPVNWIDPYGLKVYWPTVGKGVAITLIGGGAIVLSGGNPFIIGAGITIMAGGKATIIGGATGHEEVPLPGPGTVKDLIENFGKEVKKNPLINPPDPTPPEPSPSEPSPSEPSAEDPADPNAGKEGPCP